MIYEYLNQRLCKNGLSAAIWYPHCHMTFESGSQMLHYVYRCWIRVHEANSPRLRWLFAGSWRDQVWRSFRPPLHCWAHKIGGEWHSSLVPRDDCDLLATFSASPRPTQLSHILMLLCNKVLVRNAPLRMWIPFALASIFTDRELEASLLTLKHKLFTRQVM